MAKAKIAVMGAGLMGHGIAYLFKKNGVTPILGFGWVAAMLGVAAALLTLPLALLMRRRKSPTTATAIAAEPALSLGQQLKIAAAERSYWWLHLGFFTCGFHVAFLVTHLPGEVRLCGLSPLVSANSSKASPNRLPPTA